MEKYWLSAFVCFSYRVSKVFNLRVVRTWDFCGKGGGQYFFPLMLKTILDSKCTKQIKLMKISMMINL